MKKAVIYIHGKGGNAEEAAHYIPHFPDCTVLGMPYKSETPWEAKQEFSEYLDAICMEYDTVTLIANSIGAYFAMHADIPKNVEQAFFISPIGDMEALIHSMMQWANVTEAELQEKGEIPTNFGETLSWDYLQYVRTHPIRWQVPTRILSGEHDTMTPAVQMAAFAEKISAPLTTMPGGEHWFHTPEQMAFLDTWITKA